MVENYGGLKNASILIGQESDFGTPVPTNRDIGIVTDWTSGATNEVIQSRGFCGRELQQLNVGPWRFTLDVTTEFQHGRLMEYALGTVGDAGGADPYTHTVTVASTLPSFTVAVGLDGTVDDEESYAGCKVNEYVLAMDLGGVMTQRATILAKTVLTDTSASAAVCDDLPTLPWSVATVETGVAASEVTIAQARSFELTIGNNLEPIDKLSSNLSENFLEQGVDYSLRTTVAFTDIKERGKFLDGTATGTAPDADDFNGFSTILKVDRTADNRSVVATLSDCHYSEYSRPIAVSGLIIQDFTTVFKSASIVCEDDIADWST